MWLVSLSFESQLSTEECISLPSPGLFSVSHPRGTVSNNTECARGPLSYRAQLCKQSGDLQDTLPRILTSSRTKPLHFCISLGALGFPVLMPVPAPPSNSLHTRSAEIAKPAPDFPTSIWSFQPDSLTLDRNIKLYQLTAQ